MKSIVTSFFILFITLSTTAFAQNQNFQSTTFKGLVVDATTKEPLAGANVVMAPARDTTRKFGVITDADGLFTFPRVREGMKIKLTISFVGYHSIVNEITLEKLDEIKRFEIQEQVEQLDEVKVTAVQTRVEMKGDTAAYNAAAFKVNKDASAQDLLTKMPGVVNQNGTLQAQGEQVKRVLVDGQEFFGDDPNLALKSLPAEVISQIQIFDRQSDQSQFTGFNDGNTEKTINIVTKGGLQNGTFGRFFGAYGTEDRYVGGGNINYFKGNERISVVGLVNNINQQNFSTEDLVGIAQSAQGSRTRGPGMSRSGANPGDFLIGQQSGINTTGAFGINYSNAWANKFKFNTSYFFNGADNTTDQGTFREYFLEGDETQYYDEASVSKNTNYNHRFTARGEYTIDKKNSIIFSPRISFQDNEASSNLFGTTRLGDTQNLSNLTNQNSSTNQAFSLNNSILWRYRFDKPMRTLSLDFRTSINTRDGESNVYSLNDILYPVASQRITDQLTTTVTDSYSFGLSTFYTEPIFAKSQLMIRYNPEFTVSNSDQMTYAIDSQTGAYTVAQPTLSSKFESQTLSQQGGVSLRAGGFMEPGSWMASLNVQHTVLDGSQTYPTAFDINKNWFKILPGAMWSYRKGQNFNVRIFYRTFVQTPSVSQFQTVINNTNPLFLSSGNPNLDQQYNHSLFTRIQLMNTKSGQSFFLFANGSLSNSYLGTSTVIASSDTTLANGVQLTPGAQYSRPENLSGYRNFRTFGTYSIPSSWVKSTLNFNLGFTYAGTPSVINDVTSTTHTYNSNAGLTVASNISENVDFTLQYSGNYVTAENKLQPSVNANYYNGLASGKIEVLLWDKLVLASDVNYSHFNGLTDGYNQNFALWNASIGYKFLKNKQAELRLSLFDILKANRSINRNVTETYVEDVQTQIIQQYALVTFTYNLRSFVTGKKQQDNEPRPPFMQGSGRGPGRGWD